jgi:hypothetical protein
MPEVSASVLKAISASTKSLHEKLSTSGTKMSKAFRPPKVYERPNDVEQAAEHIDACHNTFEELAKAYEECAKERDEAVELAREALEKTERLLKGEKICPVCIGVKTVNSQPCVKCKGEGFLS